MRNAPLSLAAELAHQLATAEANTNWRPDLVFCSEMLDLAQWRGFLCNMSRQNSATPELAKALLRISTLPAVCYFHENQWTYPISPQARDDAHYGYTNLLTALASDECWFNSDFHRREFLGAARAFIARMPDARPSHDLDALEQRSRVVPPGFEPVSRQNDAEQNALRQRGSAANEDSPLCIGWAARWEHDKRPDRFEKLLQLLEERELPFELVLLGSRPNQAPAALQSIETRWARQIRFNGYAKSKSEYHRWLQEMDVIVSTADHEFFGIAICEAISAGAVPVLPDDLSYPELVEPAFRYETLQEAANMIERLATVGNGQQLAAECFSRLAPFTRSQVLQAIDDGVARVSNASG